MSEHSDTRHFEPVCSASSRSVSLPVLAICSGMCMVIFMVNFYFQL